MEKNQSVTDRGGLYKIYISAIKCERQNIVLDNVQHIVVF